MRGCCTVVRNDYCGCYREEDGSNNTKSACRFEFGFPSGSRTRCQQRLHLFLHHFTTTRSSIVVPLLLHDMPRPRSLGDEGKDEHGHEHDLTITTCALTAPNGDPTAENRSEVRHSAPLFHLHTPSPPSPYAPSAIPTHGRPRHSLFCRSCSWMRDAAIQLDCIRYVQSHYRFLSRNWQLELMP